MVLAAITLVIVVLFIKVESRLLKLILFFIWILFFPNTFYFITDLIHISRFDFFDQVNYSVVFLKNLEGYIFIIFILFGTYISVKMGLESLNLLIIYNIENKIIKIPEFILVIIISFLSSVGIYIGRFLRFNSWDVLKPWKLMESIVSDTSVFTLIFIMLFTLTHLFLIYFDQKERGFLWKK